MIVAAPIFPARPTLLGCVAGAHPKLLLIEKNGRYMLEDGATTHTKRHKANSEVVNQLHAYCQSKLHQDSSTGIPQLLQAIHESLGKKAWGLSKMEIHWVMEELRDKLSNTVAGVLPQGHIGMTASDDYSRELFRQLVLAYLLAAPDSVEALAVQAGVTESSLDEIGAGKLDVDLDELEKVGKIFGLMYLPLPKIAEVAQLHLPTTGPSKYSSVAQHRARCAKRVQDILSKMAES